MESGHHKELRSERIIQLGSAFCVLRAVRGSSTYGGNALRSIKSQIQGCFISSKEGRLRTASRNVPGEQQLLQLIGIPCHPCKGQVKVYIDGSATKIGASCYAGRGLWTPDNQSFNDNGALKRKEQGSDRAEVRALVAALEQTEETIEVITDNQYVRDTEQYIAAGGTVHKGKH
eukprot:8327006-Heterocapsa_arctica.AAC.1